MSPKKTNKTNEASKASTQTTQRNQRPPTVPRVTRHSASQDTQNSSEEASSNQPRRSVSSISHALVSLPHTGTETSPTPATTAPVATLNPALGIQHEAIGASLPRNLPPPITTPTGGSQPQRHRPQRLVAAPRSAVDANPPPLAVTSTSHRPDAMAQSVSPHRHRGSAFLAPAAEDIEQFSDDDREQLPRQPQETGDATAAELEPVMRDIHRQLHELGVQPGREPKDVAEAYWVLQRLTVARDAADWARQENAAQPSSSSQPPPPPNTDSLVLRLRTPTPTAQPRQPAPASAPAMSRPTSPSPRPQRSTAGKRKPDSTAAAEPMSPATNKKKRAGSTTHHELGADTWSGRMFANRRISYTPHPDLDSTSARPHRPAIPEQPLRDVSHAAAMHLFLTRIHNRLQHAFPPNITARLVNVPGDGSCQLHAIAAVLDVTRTADDPFPIQELALRNLAHQELLAHPDRYQPWFARDQGSPDPAASYQEYVSGVLYQGRQADHLMLAVLENVLRVNIFVLRRLIDPDGNSNRMAYQESPPQRTPGRENWPALTLLFIPASAGEATSGHYLAMVPSRIDLLPGPRQRLLTAVAATDEFLTNAVRNRLYALSDSASVSSNNTASPTSLASNDVLVLNTRAGSQQPNPAPVGSPLLTSANTGRQPAQDITQPGQGDRTSRGSKQPEPTNTRQVPQVQQPPPSNAQANRTAERGHTDGLPASRPRSRSRERTIDPVRRTYAEDRHSTSRTHGPSPQRLRRSSSPPSARRTTDGRHRYDRRSRSPGRWRESDRRRSPSRSREYDRAHRRSYSPSRTDGRYRSARLRSRSSSRRRYSPPPVEHHRRSRSRSEERSPGDRRRSQRNYYDTGSDLPRRRSPSSSPDGRSGPPERHSTRPRLTSPHSRPHASSPDRPSPTRSTHQSRHHADTAPPPSAAPPSGSAGTAPPPATTLETEDYAPILSTIRPLAPGAYDAFRTGDSSILAGAGVIATVKPAPRVPQSQDRLILVLSPDLPPPPMYSWADLARPGQQVLSATVVRWLGSGHILCSTLEPIAGPRLLGLDYTKPVRVPMDLNVRFCLHHVLTTGNTLTTSATRPDPPSFHSYNALGLSLPATVEFRDHQGGVHQSAHSKEQKTLRHIAIPLDICEKGMLHMRGGPHMSVDGYHPGGVVRVSLNHHRNEAIACGKLPPTNQLANLVWYAHSFPNGSLEDSTKSMDSLAGKIFGLHLPPVSQLTGQSVRLYHFLPLASTTPEARPPPISNNDQILVALKGMGITWGILYDVSFRAAFDTLVAAIERDELHRRCSYHYLEATILEVLAYFASHVRDGKPIAMVPLCVGQEFPQDPAAPAPQIRVPTKHTPKEFADTLHGLLLLALEHIHPLHETPSLDLARTMGRAWGCPSATTTPTSTHAPTHKASTLNQRASPAKPKGTTAPRSAPPTKRTTAPTAAGDQPCVRDLQQHFAISAKPGGSPPMGCLVQECPRKHYKDITSLPADQVCTAIDAALAKMDPAQRQLLKSKVKADPKFGKAK
jgi:hypothetical protein